MKKSKILAAALCTSMLATAVVGGTLAYFTDVDKDDNVFQMGNVKIEQNEYERIPEADGELQVFTQNKNVLPAVHKNLTKGPLSVNGYDFNIRSLEGNYVDKIVNVKNTGNNQAYVRTVIAVPNMNGFDDGADASENPLHWNYLDATDFGKTGWDWNGSNDAEATTQKCYAKDVVINGASYDLYVATYNAPLAANTYTSPSMVGFYLDDGVDCDQDGYFQMVGNYRRDLNPWMKPDADGKVTLKFLVFSQACQVEGFADAWEALDASFGVIDQNNNPWMGN